MSLIPEQISAAAQTQLSTQLDAIQALSNATFGGLEKLIALHLNTVKQSLDTVSAATQQLLTASTPQELLALTTAKTPAPLDAFLSYGREIADISINARATFFQAVSASGAPVVTTLEFNFPPQKETVAKSTAPTKTSKKTSSTLVIDVPVVAPVSKAATPEQKPSSEQKPATEKIASVVVAEKQLPLLTETESSKPATAVVSASTPVITKSSISPVSTQTTTTNKTTAGATPTAPAATTPAKPVVAAAKTTKPVTAKPTPALNANAAAPVKAAAIKPAVKTVTPPVAAPVAVKAVPEKKSAVKFPFPPKQKTQNGKPALAGTSNQPAYKAKASAATGAKKPVRQ
ncbi:phasin family protein [Undibacterium sp. SXout7W]|uniref:phasin family protein n=1 Tax=Undibacterium sp. SXout7W TaxID=3413049 RepID=UPI003BF109A7